MVVYVLFQAGFDQKIELRRPLAVLASRTTWTQIKSISRPAFEPRNLQGNAVVAAISSARACKPLVSEQALLAGLPCRSSSWLLCFTSTTYLMRVTKNRSSGGSRKCSGNTSAAGNNTRIYHRIDCDNTDVPVIYRG